MRCPYRREHEYDDEGLCRHCYAPNPKRPVLDIARYMERLNGERVRRLLVGRPVGIGLIRTDGAEPPASAGYSRVIVRAGLKVAGTAPNQLTIWNDCPIVFPTPGGSWGIVSTAAVYSDADLIVTGAIPPKLIDFGDAAPSFQPHSFVIEIRV